MISRPSSTPAELNLDEEKWPTDLIPFPMQWYLSRDVIPVVMPSGLRCLGADLVFGRSIPLSATSDLDPDCFQSLGEGDDP